jgi:hypothetical protein
MSSASTTAGAKRVSASKAQPRRAILRENGVGTFVDEVLVFILLTIVFRVFDVSLSNANVHLRWR